MFAQIIAMFVVGGTELSFRLLFVNDYHASWVSMKIFQNLNVRKQCYKL